MGLSQRLRSIRRRRVRQRLTERRLQMLLKSSFVAVATTTYLLWVSGLSPAAADCLSQCESQHQTCLRGCTSSNAKACVDSCFRGSSACRSRCRSETPAQAPAVRTASIYRPILAALSYPEASCRRTSEAGLSDGIASICRSTGAVKDGQPLMAAVTCRSNEWCCRHEDFSKGTCAKCCPK